MQEVNVPFSRCADFEEVCDAVQALYRLYHPECDPNGPCGISLQGWIAIFGALQLIISQLPNISSLKELNLFCTACTVLFAAGSLSLSIYNGGHQSSELQAHRLQFHRLQSQRLQLNNKGQGQHSVSGIIRCVIQVSAARLMLV